MLCLNFQANASSRSRDRLVEFFLTGNFSSINWKEACHSVTPHFSLPRIFRFILKLQNGFERDLIYSFTPSNTISMLYYLL